MFETEDHRRFNENGEHFNVGETFAGLGFAKGVELADKLRWIADGRGGMTQAALRWILDHESISCVIPGFKNERQVHENLEAANVSSFSSEELERLTSFYRQEVSPFIRGSY